MNLNFIFHLGYFHAVMYIFIATWFVQLIISLISEFSYQNGPEQVNNNNQLCFYIKLKGSCYISYNSLKGFSSKTYVYILWVKVFHLKLKRY